MSRIITARDGRRFRRLSRWIKLQPYASGNDYFFRFGGCRYRLSQCERLTYPEFYDDDGKLAYLSAYIPLTNTYALLIEMEYSSSEYVRIYEEIDTEE